MLWLLLYALNSALLNRSGHKYIINVLFRFSHRHASLSLLQEIFVYILFHFGIKERTNLFTLWKYQCELPVHLILYLLSVSLFHVSTFFSLFRFECHQTRSTLRSSVSVSLCMGVIGDHKSVFDPNSFCAAQKWWRRLSNNGCFYYFVISTHTQFFIQ